MWLFQICSFPNGADFCGRANLTPDQHIYRRANPSWVPDRPDRPRRGNRPPLPPQPLATISKFRVRRYLHNNGEYWSPYDLLGLFLSFMGPAPDGATKRNFYLPLTAVYGRWCHQIAGSCKAPLFHSAIRPKKDETNLTTCEIHQWSTLYGRS